MIGAAASFSTRCNDVQLGGGRRVRQPSGEGALLKKFYEKFYGGRHFESGKSEEMTINTSFVQSALHRLLSKLLNMHSGR